ncbi:S49 family peptidase [Magnetococcales bacterium HHB-1]
MDKTEPSLFSEKKTAAPPSPPPPPENKNSKAALLTTLIEDHREERKVLRNLLEEFMSEQRKSRRNRWIFRGFIAVYLIVLLWFSGLGSHSMEPETTSEQFTAEVRIQGMIAPDQPASAKKILPALNEAFKATQSSAVILRINSPGGSPVQAGIIYDEIIRLQEKYKKPAYAVLEDLCASGGYYIAAAAKEVYANQATLVGSIGVILRSFGFEKAMEKLGVENRLLTAGKSKAFLDPFGPINEKQKQHAEKLLRTIHKQFKTAVKKGRGARLKAPDNILFEGLIWTGEEAVNLGLIDGLASAEEVARDIIKAERIEEFSHKEKWFEQVTNQLVAQKSQALLHYLSRHLFMQ